MTAMTAEQLLPCPFCGAAAIERWHRSGDDGYFEVCCVRTACTTFRHGDDERQVRAEWNKRHLAARLSGMAADTWQPIETAPKDGAEILVCWPMLRVDSDADITDEVVGYARSTSAWVDSWRGGAWTKPGDLETSAPQFNDYWDFGLPTHWRELPAAPEPPHV
jgi:hypothetical protein